MVVIKYNIMTSCISSLGLPKHQCLAGIMTSHQLHGWHSTAPFKQPTNTCTCITTIFAWLLFLINSSILSIVMWQRVSPLLILLVLSCVIAAVYAQSKFLDTDQITVSYNNYICSRDPDISHCYMNVDSWVQYFL